MLVLLATVTVWMSTENRVKLLCCLVLVALDPAVLLGPERPLARSDADLAHGVGAG